MTELKCSVHSCANHKDNMCCKPNIAVSGKDACCCDETCCSSYSEKGTKTTWPIQNLTDSWIFPALLGNVCTTIIPFAVQTMFQ